MPVNEECFICVAARQMGVGQCDLSIEPNAGSDEEIANGRTYHMIGFSVEPTGDQFPYLVVTDLDLYVDGDIPDALDGLRISQSLESDDYEEFIVPWIRPGSAVGMAEVIFEPPSKREGDNWDPDAGKYLTGCFELCVDRVGDQWRVEIRLNHEESQGADSESFDFHAVFISNLEIIQYDQE